MALERFVMTSIQPIESAYELPFPGRIHTECLLALPSPKTKNDESNPIPFSDINQSKPASMPKSRSAANTKPNILITIPARKPQPAQHKNDDSNLVPFADINQSKSARQTRPNRPSPPPLPSSLASPYTWYT